MVMMTIMMPMLIVITIYNNDMTTKSDAFHDAADNDGGSNSQTN